jgi:hypothetical protein
MSRVARRIFGGCAGGTLVIVIGACGTDPSPDVTGSWSTTMSFAGGSLECSTQGVLTLQGTGSDLSGTLVEVQAACSEQGVPISISLSDYSIAATREGSSIGLRLQAPPEQQGCSEFVLDGQARDAEMTGTLATEPIFCQGTYVEMTGTWSATRLQP